MTEIISLAAVSPYEPPSPNPQHLHVISCLQVLFHDPKMRGEDATAPPLFAVLDDNFEDGILSDFTLSTTRLPNTCSLLPISRVKSKLG